MDSDRPGPNLEPLGRQSCKAWEQTVHTRISARASGEQRRRYPQAHQTGFADRLQLTDQNTSAERFQIGRYDHIRSPGDMDMDGPNSASIESGLSTARPSSFQLSFGEG